MNDSQNDKCTIFIVVPCYNEEEVLRWSAGKLLDVISQMKQHTSDTGRILFVDDGSKDNTWAIINELSKEHSEISGLKLSHNEGHQTALWAGLEQVAEMCDATISIDADLQDDENAILNMVKKFDAGFDIVYGVRKSRTTDTWFKRFSAQSFYKLMKSVDKEMIYNHADFRLMSRRAVKAMLEYSERNVFLRGIVRQLGFREDFVYYDRKARTAGESKYPLKKMLAFSLDGITSFSIAPLKWITFIGLMMILVSLIMIIYALVSYAEDDAVSGWTSMLVSLWLIGGMITTGIGVTGIYIDKIYTESKRRPRYFIDEKRNL